MAWTNSNRRQRLPANWQTIRTRILRRDNGTCQIAGPRCTTLATDVDHITPGDNHHHTNLQAACKPCHATKSGQEGQTARNGDWRLRRRPAEQHPGDL